MLSDAGKIGHQGEPLHHYHFLRQANHRRDGAGVDGCDDADRMRKHRVQADYTDRTQSVHQSPYAHRAGGFSEFYQ